MTPFWRTRDKLPNSTLILNEIHKAEKILLHCHPTPDPDSVGSVLAMKFALEGLGKKVTAIRGDSEIPLGFMHFPGVEELVKKSYPELDPHEFDLFVILDSGSPEMISRSSPSLPLPMRTITIDHHVSNTGYADINLVHSAPSTTYLLYQLFKEWGITLTPEISANLFIGLYTDTGGFKFPPADYHTFEVAAELTKNYRAFTELISYMENSLTEDSIRGEALALNSIRTFHNNSMAVSVVSHKELSDRKISTNTLSGGHIANVLKSVIGWELAVSLVEIEPDRVKASFRTRDPKRFDVSKIATTLGGGGHKGAAGAILTIPLEEAVSKVVETAGVVYNL